MAIDDIIEQLAASQRAFVGTRFVAPVLPGGKVRVRIEGAVAELRIVGQRPAGLASAGLAVLEAVAIDRARVVERPRRRQVADYYKLFPRVRLLLVEPAQRDGADPLQRWRAVRAQAGSQAVDVSGVVTVLFVDGAGRFDTVLTRFDGQNFFFEARDRRRERAYADYLSEAFREERDPAELDKAGLTKLERDAYLLALLRTIERRQEQRAQSAEGKLQAALEHAGAELASFVEHGDRYQVSWTIDGQRHTSAVAKSDDLSLLVAGICLAGQDRRYDLASLVGVVKNAPGVPRIGDDGMSEDEYFGHYGQDDD